LEEIALRKAAGLVYLREGSPLSWYSGGRKMTDNWGHTTRGGKRQRSTDWEGEV